MDESRDVTRNNVAHIDDARKKNPKEKPKKPQRAELFQAIADAINRKYYSELPGFNERLVIYSASPSMRVIGHLAEGDVITVHENDVPAEAAIMGYCNRELLGREEYRWTAKNVRDCRDFWTLSTDPLLDVKPFRWKSEPGYTFNRLPWDRDQQAPTPTWSWLLRHMTNRLALRQWIGSLFIENSYTHQYVWVHGQGGDGKGSINRFLAKVFGGAYCSKQPPAKGDKFWTYGLIGRRLVAFPDCDDTKFVTTGFFKSLSGGDPMPAEAKGKMGFTFQPIAKYIFFSNDKPKISSERADTRRIIYCEFPSNDEDLSWDGIEEKLWDEGGAFLTNCIQEYYAAHPTPGPIICGTDEIQEHLSVVEERFEVIFDRYFCRTPAPHDKLDELKLLDWEAVKTRSVVPSVMQDILRHYFRSNNEIGEFVRWLQVNLRIKKAIVRPEGVWPALSPPKVYVGIMEKRHLPLPS